MIYMEILELESGIKIVQIMINILLIKRWIDIQSINFIVNFTVISHNSTI